MLRSAIDQSLALGALLLFPGNVYNFGAGMPAVLDAHTPQRPTTPLGQVRVALEQQLAQAVATQGLRAIIVRAGDFFDAGQGTWLDQVIARKLLQGVMTWPGPLNVPHAWAYLPDLARTFVRVAEQRQHLAAAQGEGDVADQRSVSGKRDLFQLDLLRH